MSDIYKAKTGEDKAEKKPVSLSIKSLRDNVEKLGHDSFLTSLSTFPAKVCFDTQDEGEVVVLFMRQHPIVNVPWIALVVFLLILPPLFAFFPPYAMLTGAYQVIVNLTFYLVVMGIVLSQFMAWFFNIYIVTDERIVDVDFVNLFYRVVSTAKLDEIQDVNIVASGVFETFFNYGSVFVQTAAEVTQFEFGNIPRPDRVGRLLNKMIDMEEQEKIEGRVK